MNTVEFAAYELNRYTAAMGTTVNIELAVDVKQFDTKRFFRFDARYDDAFEVEVQGGAGHITATNERAVLLGVYHFLKTQGCRFLKPGKDGEYIPQVDAVQDVSEIWYAKMRHRGSTDGYCGGEGLAAEGMLEYIDWLPKVMMNTYFIELPDYYSDMQAQYLHSDNPYKKPEHLTYEQYLTYDSWIVREMKKRGLLRHGAGHGWTVSLMEGITKTSRNVESEVCTNPEILAETDGERKIFVGKPLFTNLCYSRADVRRKMAEKVYEYSLEHPEVDFIHVWLADYYNNFCECENCRKLAQSDWYIMLLNEIDEVFTEQKSDKKIVFLIYFELAYPPIKERIKNEDRFVMMFAPYGRDFTKAYRDWEAVSYERAPLNKFRREYMDMRLYLTQLKEWQQIYKGDSFVFDYNLYDSASHTEVTNVGYAPIPYQDCLDLIGLGLNGRVECGDTCAMTPTSLALYGMAHALFYGTLTYEELEEEYFTSAYGKEQKISDFLKKMSAVLPRDYMLCRTDILTEEDRYRLKKGLVWVRQFREELFFYLPEEAVHRRNCRYFKEYLDILEFIVQVMADKAEGCSEEKVEAYIEEYRHLLYRKEAVMPGYMSASRWFGHIRNGFRNKNELKEF